MRLSTPVAPEVKTTIRIMSKRAGVEHSPSYECHPCDDEHESTDPRQRYRRSRQTHKPKMIDRQRGGALPQDHQGNGWTSTDSRKDISRCQNDAESTEAPNVKDPRSTSREERGSSRARGEIENERAQEHDHRIDNQRR